MLEEVADAGSVLLGWTGNQDAPLYASADGGRTWGGRPVLTYEGDQLITTGAAASPVGLWVLGGRTFAVLPGREYQLLVTGTPPTGFVPVRFEPSAAFLDWSHGENRSTDEIGRAHV